MLHLAQRVEGNLLAAAQEIDKLALLCIGTPRLLEPHTWQSLVADSARFDVFRLIDATLAGRARRWRACSPACVRKATRSLR